ncbi:MAG: deoxyribodipyrimidine photo-lyase [Desulfovibrionaceae bacterium]
MDMKDDAARRVHPDRLRLCREGPPPQGPVILWMSRDQRVHDNWALLHAQDVALAAHVPLEVVFCLAPAYPGATLRHYHFMLHGLREVREACLAHGIGFTLLPGHPPETLAAHAAARKAGAVVTDFDPLRLKRQWLDQACARLTVPVVEVDAHNIVPCRRASGKQEYAAATFRPKIHRLLPEFLTPFPPLLRHPFPAPASAAVDWDAACAFARPDPGVGPVETRPGMVAGRAALDAFVAERLARYAAQRNDPNAHAQSGLSPYFHFGQLAPQRAALAAHEALERTAGTDANALAFLEELIVRRELSDNFCLHNPAYDRLEGAADWARATLAAHSGDTRAAVYDTAAFEAGATHEALWNAAQTELVRSGGLHGYMRMYWAKKILEWSATPEEAVATAIRLNDRYALDGRDPNGYVGVLWSVAGVHDRAWAERPVYGKIRYMNERGCRRKFDVPAYVARWRGDAQTAAP